MIARRAPIPWSGRLGTWVGAFGWWIGFVLVTWPHSDRFATELAGGALLNVGWVLSFEWALRYAQRRGAALYGALCTGVAAIGFYYELVVEPAVRANPDVAAHLVSYGASLEFPDPIAWGAAMTALPLLVIGFWPMRTLSRG